MKVLFTGNMPRYMTDGAAGADLIAAEEYTINPGDQAMVNTGTSIALGGGSFAMLLPRSSLCNKKHLILANSAGIIDSDYRGPIMCCYRNSGTEAVTIKEGERICQIIIMAHSTADFELTEALPDTVRGDGGFGSTDEPK